MAVVSIPITTTPSFYASTVEDPPQINHDLSLSPSPPPPPHRRRGGVRQRRRRGARLRRGRGEGSGLRQGRAYRRGRAVADPAPPPRVGEGRTRALPRRRPRHRLQHHALPPRRRGELHYLPRGLGPSRRRLRHHRQHQYALELLLRFVVVSHRDRRQRNCLDPGNWEGVGVSIAVADSARFLWELYLDLELYTRISTTSNVV